jgi:hypothetical protein
MKLHFPKLRLLVKATMMRSQAQVVSELIIIVLYATATG